MFVPFNIIHDQARIWIFQGSRKFNSLESNIISEALSAFTEGWLVHGSPMQSSFDLRFDQFIILVADEDANAASGCSIDDSVRTLKKIGVELSIDFFDRNQVAFKKQDAVLTVPVANLKKALEEKIWSHETLMFNNLINTKGDLDREWLVQAGSTWLKRYLRHETLAG